MVNVNEDIHSLSDFKRMTPRFLKRLKESGRPVVLTVNGRAELVVFDAASYQRLAEQLERAETVAAIKESLMDLHAGKGTSAGMVLREMRKKYGIKKPA